MTSAEEGGEDYYHHPPMLIPEDPEGALSGGTVFLFNSLALAACEGVMRETMQVISLRGKGPVDFFVLEAKADVVRVLAARTPKNLVLVLHGDDREAGLEVALGDPSAPPDGDRVFPLHHQLHPAREGEQMALGTRFMTSRDLVEALVGGHHTPACIVMHFRDSAQEVERLLLDWNRARGNPPLCMAWQDPILHVRATQTGGPECSNWTEEEVATAKQAVGRLSRQEVADLYLSTLLRCMAAGAPLFNALAIAASTAVTNTVIKREHPVRRSDDQQAVTDLVHRIRCIVAGMLAFVPEDVDTLVDTCKFGIFGDFVVGTLNP